MATGSGDLTEDRGATKSKVSELLELQSSDHPGFITGKCVRPDENSDDFEKWMRVDCMVISWLLNSISKDIVDAFLYTAFAHDLWTELEQRFGECNGPLLYQIQREIASISQGALSVTGYFTKLKQLWDELTYLAPVPHCNCEYSRTVVDYATSNQLMQFLMGLNDIYDHMRNQILVTDPLPNVNKAYSIILRVEKQRQINLSLHEGNEGAAMFTRAGAYKKDGQNKSDFKKRNFVDKKNLRCDNCNRSGHDRNTCFKIHGIPNWYKDLTEQRKKDGTGAEFSMSKLVTIELKLRLIPPQMQHQSLIFGATNHMCANSSLFHSLTLLKKPVSIRLPDNSSKTVTQSGTICLNDKISLAHVLYVPFFHNNLISDRMTEEVLAVARQTNRLYILDPSSFSRNLIDMHCRKLSCKVFHVAHGDVFLWHQRLGHPSFKTLQHVKGFSSSVLTDNTICDVCPMAKQSRLPFQTSTSKSSTLFELIHIDLWGPYKHASLSGCHFFLTIVDDYSRTTWTYLLKHKSQAVPLLETYLQMVQTQFDAKILHLYSTTKWPCRTQTPTSFEYCKSSYDSSIFTKKILGGSHSHSNLLINRLPSSLLGWKTPYEILHQRSPTYDQLKTFGCLAFACNVKPFKDKFDARAHKDVVFHEQNFPFSTSVLPDLTATPLPLVSLTDDPLMLSNPNPQLTDVPEQSHLPHSTSTDLHFSSSSSELNPSLPHDEVTSLPSPVIPIRRSTRQSHKPPWMSDFVCNHSSSFTDAHMSFVGHLSILQEPSTFSQAQQHAEWREAMNHELTALENNHTWELTTLPEGKRAIGSKWVYKVKLNPDGTVERYKARLVAKGYNQIEGLDINNAFLHGYLDEAVYMTPPEGYEAPSGMVCKLKRSLYGLKQASRQWNLEFTTQLTAYGFRQSANDHCLFTLSSAHGFLALLVYVDDVLITGTSDTLIQNVKSYLDRLFTIKDLGFVKYFLGLEVARSTDGLSVSQHKYICDIVTELHLQDAKTCTTPLPSGLKFSANEGALLQEPDRQFLQHPTQQHWDAAIHVVRYLKGSSSMALFFPSQNSLQLSAFSDADWATCVDSRREYRAMATTVCELLWITYILKDFQVPLTTPVPFWCDNQAALHITANPVFHERTKHLDIDCHIVRDQYKAGFISPRYIAGHLQPADAFTKILPVAAFTQSSVKLGLVSLPHAPT
ncbi:Retrovirus-related Pol polyprotein from transposon RE1 [Sesamum angolense]|uniref:Retrovirus-related Pol polyprotein from transposon RE1 n=1 Tax=Sesamum angolense TaxID=2727404 RepID=A0AAE2C7R9_9LAMI|nr:Retrovirus-related Pol polyprotein from transposon RE1 [Sesamum angolense]